MQRSQNQVSELDQERLHVSTLWGPTCDAVDKFPENYLLPELDIGDQVEFPNMGAYSSCLTTTFNGMPKPRCYYVISEEAWDYLFAQTSA